MAYYKSEARASLDQEIWGARVPVARTERILIADFGLTWSNGLVTKLWLDVISRYLVGAARTGTLAPGASQAKERAALSGAADQRLGSSEGSAR